MDFNLFGMGWLRCQNPLFRCVHARLCAHGAWEEGRNGGAHPAWWVPVAVQGRGSPGPEARRRDSLHLKQRVHPGERE